MEHVTMIRGRFSGRQIAVAYARPIRLRPVVRRWHWGRIGGLAVMLASTVLVCVALYAFVSAAMGAF